MLPPPFDFSAYDRIVIGYHGTDVASAERLVNGESFAASDRDNEWFGRGVYFWEHAPKQAWWWSKSVRKAKKPAVVGALIRLGNCLDLLDSENTAVLKEFKTSLELGLARESITLPKNHRGDMRLDCTVFNAFYKASEIAKSSIDSARAVYVPTGTKKRIWEKSWINEQSHIQICARNPRNILAVWHVRRDGRYGKTSEAVE